MDRMKVYYRTRAGFTLLEVVASIVLIAIVSMIAAAAVVYVAQGFVLVSTGTEMARNVHIATSRIIKELESLNSITETKSAPDPDITYKDPDLTSHTLSYNGTALLLDSVTLLDGFFDGNSFEFRYLNSYDNSPTHALHSLDTEMVEIWMKMDLGNGSSVEFTTRVFLRNL